MFGFLLNYFVEIFEQFVWESFKSWFRPVITINGHFHKLHSWIQTYCWIMYDAIFTNDIKFLNMTELMQTQGAICVLLKLLKKAARFEKRYRIVLNISRSIYVFVSSFVTSITHIHFNSIALYIVIVYYLKSYSYGTTCSLMQLFPSNAFPCSH